MAQCEFWDQCGDTASRIVHGKDVCDDHGREMLGARQEWAFAGRCRCGATSAHVWTGACEAQAGADVPQAGISTSGTPDRATGPSGAKAGYAWPGQDVDDARVGAALRRVLAATDGEAFRVYEATGEVIVTVYPEHYPPRVGRGATVAEALEQLATVLEAQA